MSPVLLELSRRSIACLALLCCLVATSTATLAQTTSGSVAITIVDPNGAAVTGAQLTLLNADTGANFESVSSDNGNSRFPSLAPGNYQLTVNAPNFAAANADVKVLLNQETSVTLTLSVAGVGETVDVSAGEEAVVQTSTSQLGASFSTIQVTELPTGNNTNALALLAPGVTTQGGGLAGSGGSVGGARARSNAFNIDGVDNTDPSVVAPSTPVIQDAVAEFTLLQNNFSAEFGSAAAGQFNTITKSGTNEYHGNAFWYVQNKNLNARSSAQTSEAFRDASGATLPKPRLDRNRVGGTIGGPVFKDKLFFFGAYEYSNEGRAGSTDIFFAPTGEGFGILSGLGSVSPFTLNILSQVTPASVATDTVEVAGRDIPIGQVVVTIPSFFNQHQFQVNMDYNPRSQDQIRGRYSWSRLRSEQPGNGGTAFNNLLTFDTRLFSLTEVHSFSPTIVNELRLSYRNTRNDFPLKNEAFTDFPNITITDIGLGIGPNGNLPQGGFDYNYQLLDSVSWQVGNHSVKFGGELRRLIFTSFFLPRGRGDYIYSTLDLFLRDQVPDQLDLRGVGSAAFTGNNWQTSLYVQDDWKIRPNLTFNIGLRYDYLSLPRDAALQELNAISSVPGVIDFKVPETDKNDFAPRIGIAYAPDFQEGWLHTLFGDPGQSSIRGGFALAYDKLFQNLVLLQLPPQFQQENDAATTGVGAPFLQNGGIPANPIPPVDRASARAGTGSFITDQVSPYTMSWSLGFQREVLPSTGIEFRYQGSRGVHLPIQARLNNPIVRPEGLIIPTFFATPSRGQISGLPTLGQLNAQFPQVSVLNQLLPANEQFGGRVTAFIPAGNSIYHAGSISLTRRMSKGLALTAAYTYSALIDDSTNELFTSLVNPRRPQNVGNLRDERGRSALDHPHRFVSSFVYELPFFNDAKGLAGTLLGGFQVSGILQFESGQPITPVSGVDSNRDGDSAGDRTIFNVNGAEGTGSGVIAINASGQTVAIGSASTVAYVVRNPNAQYIQAGPRAATTAGRDTLRSNTLKNLDLTILKNFRFGENYNIQFGAEMFNATNNHNFVLSNAGDEFGVDATTSAFASVSSDLFNNYEALGNARGRTIQLRLKFIF